MSTNEKPLEWIGSSHKDLMALHTGVRQLFGFALSLAQSGDKHGATMDIIHARLKIAEAYVKELRR